MWDRFLLRAETESAERTAKGFKFCVFRRWVSNVSSTFRQQRNR